MTVNELIDKLNSIEDKSIIVLTRGYEGGYEDAVLRINDGGTPEVVTIELFVNDEWYYGPHEITEEDTQLKENKIVKGIIIR
jgi:hypothetical protein